MPKISKPLLVKIVGGSSVVATGVVGSSYALVTQREYEGLKTKIKTLTTQNEQSEKTISEQTITIKDLQKTTTNADKESDKQSLKTAKKEAENEKNNRLELERQLNEEKEKNTKLTNELSSLKTIEAEKNVLQILNKKLENDLKIEKASKKDPWAKTKNLFKQLAKWLRTKRGYGNGYNNQSVGFGTVYGIGVPEVLWLCKTDEGELIDGNDDRCKKVLTLRELEKWVETQEES